MNVYLLTVLTLIYSNAMFAFSRRNSLVERIVKIKKEKDCVRDLIIAFKTRQEIFSDLQRELIFLFMELGKRKECMLVEDTWFTYLTLIDDVYQYARRVRDAGYTIIKNLFIVGKDIVKYSEILKSVGREYMKFEEKIEKSHAIIARKLYYTRDRKETLEILNSIEGEMHKTILALKEYLEKLNTALKFLEETFKKLTLEHDTLLESIKEECRRRYLERVYEIEEKYEAQFSKLAEVMELKRESIESAIREYEGYLGLIDKLASELKKLEKEFDNAMEKYNALCGEAKREYEKECRRIREMPWEERIKLREDVSNVKEMYLIAVKNLDPENWEHILELEYEYWPAWTKFVKKIRDFWEEHVERIKNRVNETKTKYEVTVLGLKKEIERRRRRVNEARELFLKTLAQFEDDYVRLRLKSDKELEKVIQDLQRCF